jgi:hypothetical protein
MALGVLRSKDVNLHSQMAELAITHKKKNLVASKDMADGLPIVGEIEQGHYECRMNCA